MSQYRTKPIVIEARQWNPSQTGSMGWPASWGKEPWTWKVSPISLSLFIPTLEGEHEAKRGDWIIRGIKGEFYPVRDDIFRETYEPV